LLVVYTALYDNAGNINVVDHVSEGPGYKRLHEEAEQLACRARSGRERPHSHHEDYEGGPVLSRPLRQLHQSRQLQSDDHGERSVRHVGVGLQGKYQYFVCTIQLHEVCYPRYCMAAAKMLA